MDESIKKEIISWNNRFPVDKWWRDKHNVSFNSKIHRETSFLDQLFEYHEDKLFEEQRQSSSYTPNNGKWLIEQPKTKEQKQESLIEEARREMDDLPNNF